MTITISKVPDAAVKMVAKVLVERAASASFTLPKLAAAALGSLLLAFPHRVAHLPLDAIRPYADLRGVTVDAGWRFLVHERRQLDAAGKDRGEESDVFVPIASVTAAEVGDGSFQLGEFNEGPFVEGTEIAVRHAEKLQVVRDGRFEAVLLLAPAVHVIALWLQDRNGDADILMPIPPSDAALAPLRPITPRAFLEILHSLAERVRRGDPRLA